MSNFTNSSRTKFGLNKGLFPQKNRLNDGLRKPLEEHLFGGFELRTDSSGYQSRLTLKQKTGAALPYLVWSAGQREFVPLLSGHSDSFRTTKARKRTS